MNVPSSQGALIDFLLQAKRKTYAAQGDQRFPAGAFFDHFHDDHEPDVRAWLAREKITSTRTI